MELINFEDHLKEVVSNALPILLNYYGIDVYLYKALLDKYSNVYGIESGIEGVKPVCKLLVIVTNLSFVPQSKRMVGYLAEGYLYTDNDAVNVGDVISVDREDNKRRFFKITSKESIGQTQVILKRFKLASLA